MRKQAEPGRFFVVRYFGADGDVARVLRVFGTRERALARARNERRGSPLWIMELEVDARKRSGQR